MLRPLRHALVATVLAVIMLPAVAGAHDGAIPPAIPDGLPTIRLCITKP